MPKSKGINIKWDFLKAKDLFELNGLNLLSTEIKNTTDKLVCENKEGYKCVISINKLKNGRTPTVFGNNNPFIKENLILFFKKNNINSQILNDNIKNYSDNIKYKCECGYEGNKKLRDVLKLKSCRCDKCRNNYLNTLFKKDNIEIITEIESKSNLKVIECNYKNQSSTITLKCSCGNTFKTSYRKLRENFFKTTCIKCRSSNNSIKRSLSAKRQFETFMRDIEDYELIEYKGSKENSIFKHNKCGNTFYMLTGVFRSGARCECEYKSKGERKISTILYNMKIINYHEHSFEDCRSEKNFPLRFDFYIPSHNLCIEYDGEFHYKEMELRNSSLDYQLQNDKIKDEYCRNNKIELLRIPYWEFDNIENILKSALI